MLVPLSMYYILHINYSLHIKSIVQKPKMPLTNFWCNSFHCGTVPNKLWNSSLLCSELLGQSPIKPRRNSEECSIWNCLCFGSIFKYLVFIRYCLLLKIMSLKIFEPRNRVKGIKAVLNLTFTFLSGFCLVSLEAALHAHLAASRLQKRAARAQKRAPTWQKRAAP